MLQITEHSQDMADTFTPTTQSIVGKNTNEIVSLAIDSRPSASSEVNKSNEIIPEQIRSSAAKFVSFIKDYYEYLNTDGLPSKEISNILTEQDIDRASLKYLDGIQYEIASIVPNSRVIDRVSLYKKIVQYYKVRGSEDSIHIFFKIFFNEVVEVFYPKERLFTLSSGNWDGSTYLDRKGFVDNINRIHDGEFWQNFSYQIKAPIDTTQWINNFYTLVHPAGLKLFAALVLELIADTDWVGPTENHKISLENNKYSIELADGFVSLYRTEEPESNLKWLRDLVPTGLGFHTPLFQPGWLSEGLKILEFLIQVNYRELEAGSPQDDLVNQVYMILLHYYQNEKNHYERTRIGYTQNFKFFDTGTSGSYSDTPISIAIEEQDSLSNQIKFSNIGAFIESVSTFARDLIDFRDTSFLDFNDVEVVNIDTMNTRLKRRPTRSITSGDPVILNDVAVSEDILVNTDLGGFTLNSSERIVEKTRKDTFSEAPVLFFDINLAIQNVWGDDPESNDKFFLEYSQPDAMVVEGAEITEANGIYLLNGENDNKPQYEKDVGNFIRWTDFGEWSIEAAGSADSLYYAVDDVPTPDLVTSTWSRTGGSIDDEYDNPTVRRATWEDINTAGIDRATVPTIWNILSEINPDNENKNTWIRKYAYLNQLNTDVYFRYRQIASPGLYNNSENYYGFDQYLLSNLKELIDDTTTVISDDKVVLVNGDRVIYQN